MRRGRPRRGRRAAGRPGAAGRAGVLAPGLSRGGSMWGPGRGRDARAPWGRGHGCFGTVGRFLDPTALPAGRSSWPGRAESGRPSPGGGVGTWALAPSCAFLTLPPPPPRRLACCWARGLSSPASGGRVVRVFFLTHAQASVRDRVSPSRSPCLRPALCSTPAVDACGFAVWDGLRPGRISTCRECPALELTAWPRKSSVQVWVLSVLITESKFLRLA